jgi:hypothetical protein
MNGLINHDEREVTQRQQGRKIRRDLRIVRETITYEEGDRLELWAATSQGMPGLSGLEVAR